MRSEVEAALGELVSHGLVTADGFAGLRALVAPAEIKARRLRRGGVRAAFQNLESAGRWTLVRARKTTADGATTAGDDRTEEHPSELQSVMRNWSAVDSLQENRRGCESCSHPWTE